MSSETENQRGKLHQKIGRNIVLIQRIEGLMKHLISRANLSITHNLIHPTPLAPEKQIHDQEQLVAGKTMGCLKKIFCDKILSEPNNYPEGGESTEGNVVIGFNFSYGSPSQQKILRERLDDIVKDRNIIAHHIFTEFDFATSKGLDKFDTFLEQQHNTASVFFEEIKILAKSLPKQCKKLLNLDSDLLVPPDCITHPCIKEIAIHLQLYAIVIKKNKISDWSSLTLATQYVRRQCPDALLKCQEIYGVKSIKKILLKTKIYEIETKEGVVLYRMKPGYWIEDDDDGQLYLCKRLLESQEDSSSITKWSLGCTLTVENRSNQFHPQTII